MVCLEAIAISKTYNVFKKRIKVLRSVNLEVDEGEIVAIVGPSGAGKSTLLNILSTIDEPDKGEIYHLGVKIVQDEDWKAIWRREHVGIVFQQFHLIPTLTVLENVILPMYLAHKFKGHRKERALTILKKVGLEEKVHMYPSELSGGEQQRVAIARALANDPELIFADEPVSNLDVESRLRIANLFKELSEEGKCIILTTHEEEMKKISHRICELRGGVLKC